MVAFSPHEALGHAALIASHHLGVCFKRFLLMAFIFDKGEFYEQSRIAMRFFENFHFGSMKLKLSVRSTNCLENAQIGAIG